MMKYGATFYSRHTGTKHQLKVYHKEKVCICTFQVRTSPDHHNLVLWVKMDHAQFLLIKIDSSGNVHHVKGNNEH